MQALNPCNHSPAEVVVAPPIRNNSVTMAVRWCPIARYPICRYMHVTDCNDKVNGWPEENKLSIILEQLEAVSMRKYSGNNWYCLVTILLKDTLLMVQLTLILHVKIDTLPSFFVVVLHVIHWFYSVFATKQLINFMLNCKWYTYLVLT